MTSHKINSICEPKRAILADKRVKIFRDVIYECPLKLPVSGCFEDPNGLVVVDGDAGVAVDGQDLVIFAKTCSKNFKN